MLNRSRGSRRAGRPGFSLAEMIVSMTVLAVFGTIFVRFLLSQSRFADQQNAMRSARMVSRQAMNILESELRMVMDSGGVEVATADGRTLRVLVPYRFGLTCYSTSTRLTVSMLPVDSLALAQARYAGFAWRTGTGGYTFVNPGDPLGANAPATSVESQRCWGTRAGDAQIRTLTINGRAGAIFDLTPPQASAKLGAAVFFFQRITYAFQPSAAFPGSYGLWRTVQGGGTEELMAPFDSTSRFKYWTRDVNSVSVPPALWRIRGVDVVFSGRSRYTPIGRTTPAKSSLVTSIFFRNGRL